MSRRRSSDRADLEARLDELERVFGVDDRETTWVVTVASGEETDVDLAPFTVEEPIALGAEDVPSATHEQVALPVLKPRSVGGGVTVVGAAGVRRLWEIQPEAVRERELTYRREHGKPIPPVLHEEAAES